jgi:hypothetical protein
MILNEEQQSYPEINFVTVMPILGVENPRSVPERAGFLSLPQRPDCTLDTPSFPSKGRRFSYIEGKAVGT